MNNPKGNPHYECTFIKQQLQLTYMCVKPITCTCLQQILHMQCEHNTENVYLHVLSSIMTAGVNHSCDDSASKAALEQLNGAAWC